MLYGPLDAVKNPHCYSKEFYIRSFDQNIKMTILVTLLKGKTELSKDISQKNVPQIKSDFIFFLNI